MSSEDGRTRKRLEDQLNASDGVLIEPERIFEARVCHLWNILPTSRFVMQLILTMNPGSGLNTYYGKWMHIHARDVAIDPIKWPIFSCSNQDILERTVLLRNFWSCSWERTKCYAMAWRVDTCKIMFYTSGKPSWYLSLTLLAALVSPKENSSHYSCYLYQPFVWFRKYDFCF